MDKLTVSIVNFNSGDFLLRCLSLLQAVAGEIDMKIWVVDNASSDESFEVARKKFPNFQFIENSVNLGFGKAHNLVLKNVKTDYVLVLNPDVLIEKGVLKTLMDFMDKNPMVGAITPQVVFENGDVDMTAHRGFPTPWASLRYFLGDDSLYHLTNLNMKVTHEVDAITGAFFLTRKSVLDKVGLFDEDYFMYAEDIDLCYRIKQAGFKVIYCSEVSVIHYKGISTGLKKHSQHQTTADRSTKLRSVNYFYQTMKIFYKKQMESNYPFFINWLVYLGIDLRWWLAKRKLTV